MERIADNAVVVRGGSNQPDHIDQAIGMHPSGVMGFSVQCAENVSIAELARTIPHRQIGLTTVKEIRNAGGEVVRTTGRSPYHATVVGLEPEVASRLLTPTQLHPRMSGLLNGRQS